MHKEVFFLEFYEIIIFIIIFFGVAVPGIIWLLRGFLLSIRDYILRSKGIKTSAIVKEIELGGRALGNEYYPAVKLDVLVKNEKGEFYSARIDTTIPLTDMSLYQSGCEIDVVYDPAKPQNVTMIHS